jgi:programmed cell death protein 4
MVKIISPTQMEQGFERVYESLADLALDTPRAPQILHRFMQRAVRDGCLPASYARKKAQAASVNRAQGDD